MALSKQSPVVIEIAHRYIAKCHQCSKVTIRSLCKEYDHIKAGYSSRESLISAISKELIKIGFNKHQFLLDLVSSTYKEYYCLCSNQHDIIVKIRKHLSQHQLKHEHVRDLLQEIGNKSVATKEDKALEEFKSIVRQGYTFNHACKHVELGYSKLLQAKYWFINVFNGDPREAFSHYKRRHYYISPKDIIIDNDDHDLLKAIWTVIGIIFADGCVYRTSTHLTLTESDKYYLSDYVIPTVMDNSVKGNLPPKLIKQISNTHPKSYPNSKSVSKLVIEDRLFASFLNELGMQHNKIQNPVILDSRILELPDEYFFCFVSGLFDGDGCITRGSIYQTHIDLALDGEIFCSQVRAQILLRTGINLKEYCYTKASGRLTCKIQTNTNWEAFSLAAIMLFYAPFHLKRKVKRILSLFSSLKKQNSKLCQFASPCCFLSEDATELELLNYINQLKAL